MYSQWYYDSTRTLLTGPPPPRPAEVTRDAQLVQGIQRSSAYDRATIVPTIISNLFHSLLVLAIMYSHVIAILFYPGRRLS